MLHLQKRLVQRYQQCWNKRSITTGSLKIFFFEGCPKELWKYKLPGTHSQPGHHSQVKIPLLPIQGRYQWSMSGGVAPLLVHLGTMVWVPAVLVERARPPKCSWSPARGKRRSRSYHPTRAVCNIGLTEKTEGCTLVHSGWWWLRMVQKASLWLITLNNGQ